MGRQGMRRLPVLTEKEQEILSDVLSSGNVTQTAKKHGIFRQRIHELMDRPQAKEFFDLMKVEVSHVLGMEIARGLRLSVELFNKTLERKLDLLQFDEKDPGSIKDAIDAFNTAAEKFRVFQNKPSSIHERRTSNEDDAAEDLDRELRDVTPQRPELSSGAEDGQNRELKEGENA